MPHRILTLAALLMTACATTAAPRPAEAPASARNPDSFEDDWSDWAEEEGGVEPRTQVRAVSAIETLGGIRPPSTPWAEMDHNQREFYMVGIVNPIADEMLTDFDPHRGESFGCASQLRNGRECGCDHPRHPPRSLRPEMPSPASGVPASVLRRSGSSRSTNPSAWASIAALAASTSAAESSS